jgi:hypothetical protein
MLKRTAGSWSPAATAWRASCAAGAVACNAWTARTLKDPLTSLATLGIHHIADLVVK